MQKMQQRISVAGSNYSRLSREEIHQALLTDAKNKLPGYVCVSNVHTTMMGFFNRAYQRITNESRYSIPDGMPLVWAMKSLGAPEQDRVRGPSLMRDLFDLGRATNKKHYLYGGSPKALQALQKTLLKDYPGALIVGAESPPFRALEDIDEKEWQAIADKINQSGADFVWVGLGAPKQEMWMYAQRKRIQGIMLGVGAAFDLIPGIVPEAPAIFQNLGLEWFYRLCMEPRRLWRRYIFNNPAFLVIWFTQVLRAKLLGEKFLLDQSKP